MPIGCTKQFCIGLLQLPISYCVSLIMVTITRHIFINIFQTEHFSAVKFAMGCKKNMIFFCDSSLQKFEKKLKRLDLASLKWRNALWEDPVTFILWSDHTRG